MISVGRSAQVVYVRRYVQYGKVRTETCYVPRYRTGTGTVPTGTVASVLSSPLSSRSTAFNKKLLFSYIPPSIDTERQMPVDLLDDALESQSCPLPHLQFSEMFYSPGRE